MDRDVKNIIDRAHGRSTQRDITVSNIEFTHLDPNDSNGELHELLAGKFTLSFEFFRNDFQPIHEAINVIYVRLHKAVNISVKRAFPKLLDIEVIEYDSDILTKMADACKALTGEDHTFDDLDPDAEPPA